MMLFDGSWMKQAHMAQSRLITHLQQIVAEHGGLRPAAVHLNVPYSNLRRWIELKTLPDYQNAIEISQALNLPLWEVLEMAGLPLGLPPGRDAQIHRLLTLVAHEPRLLHVLTQLAAIQTDLPEVTDRVVDYLTFELQRRNIQPLTIEETPEEAIDEPPVMSPSEYLAWVENIAMQIAEEDRQSFWASLGKWTQRWLPKGPNDGRRKRPA